MRPVVATTAILCTLALYVSLALGLFGDIGRDLCVCLTATFIVCMTVDYFRLIFESFPNANRRLKRQHFFLDNEDQPSQESRISEEVFVGVEEDATFEVENRIRSRAIQAQMEIRALQGRLERLGNPSLRRAAEK